MKNTVMHVCQVCWFGSIPIFISEIAKAFPEMHHVMVYLHDRRTDYDMHSMMLRRGVEVAHAPRITQKLVSEIDPVAIIFHGTSVKSMEQPLDWLRSWPTVMFYHGMASCSVPINAPFMPVDLTLFVSKYLFNTCFAHRKKELGAYGFCPPCIDETIYTAIKRDPCNMRCVIGRIQTDSPKRHPPEVIDIFKAVQDQHPFVSFTIVGGAKYYANPPLDSLWMPSVGSRLPQSFYKSFDILLVRNPVGVSDTWSRIVTEGMAAGLPVVSENRGGPTEQIDNGVNGFLFDTDEECVEALCKLVESPYMRYTIGARAREKAAANFGLSRLRKELGSFMLKAAMGVI